jgi:hypothetical protein
MLFRASLHTERRAPRNEMIRSFFRRIGGLQFAGFIAAHLRGGNLMALSFAFHFSPVNTSPSICFQF